MPEMQGPLQGIGLPALVRFLASLEMTGTLRVAQERWNGVLWFERGRVVSATFGADRGAAAVDAIAQLLPRGDFVVADALPPAARDVDLAPEELQDRIEQSAAAAARIAPLMAAEWAVAPILAADDLDESPGDDEEIVLDRRALHTLLAISGGQRTAVDIAGERGLLETLHVLDRLYEMGLIEPASPFPGTDTRAESELTAAEQAIEWVIVPPDERTGPDEPVDVDRDAIETYLAVSSGKRSVEEIAGERGLAETVDALSRLRDMGLVRPNGTGERTDAPRSGRGAVVA